jgi:hypothetical protein
LPRRIITLFFLFSINKLMPIVLRLLLLLLAGVSILGARHASRLSNGPSTWPATPALRASRVVGFPSIAEVEPARAHQAL